MKKGSEKMNQRKLTSIKNMKKRVRNYAYEEKNSDIQYELFQLLAQIDNVLQWVE